MLTRAIVRPPANSFPNALTQLTPAPLIDLALARAQHLAYVDALRACGLEVIELPADHDHPDSVFVQDPVLVVDECTITTRAAAPSRRGEADALLEVLGAYFPNTQIEPPATLDGGDVLFTQDQIYIGLSTRSNRAACQQLATLTGRPVDGIPLPNDLLHLLSGCTYLGANRMLCVESLASAFASYETIIVSEEEAQAANVLIIDQHAIVPEGNPRVGEIVARCGYEVHLVPMSEFAKRDGGVTCSALLF